MIWKYAPYERYVRVYARAHPLFFIYASRLSVYATLQKKKNKNEQMINDGTNAGEY